MAEALASRPTSIPRNVVTRNTSENISEYSEFTRNTSVSLLANGQKLLDLDEMQI